MWFWYSNYFDDDRMIMWNDEMILITIECLCEMMKWFEKWLNRYMKLLNDFNGDGMFVNDMIKFSMYYDGSPSSIRKVGTCDERLRKYHIDSKMRSINCRSLHTIEKNGPQSHTTPPKIPRIMDLY